MDYVSKWVEAKATKTDDSQAAVGFIKANIFNRFGIPRAIVSDQGTHFFNRSVAAMVKKYGVNHRVATAYHPQSNGEAEVSNREVKSILEKTEELNSVKGLEPASRSSKEYEETHKSHLYWKRFWYTLTIIMNSLWYELD
ncbi:uncharacterized protein K02A2.6-like [Ricinus communis]|uniref:uncharacterized protein K02A2.6-like n=1 Tax=Ricinus communis TaxID=3988 RepID=UPI000D69F826|nr:uncharacterized protein K02A2.6-like [Ricinus communis]|eukprot:XP_025011870.1 uncharacterized protein K02A2.6-like [Ricinus communis]